MHTRDTLFAAPIAHLSDWTFDERVADVFPDMIQRSVPGYTHILNLIGMLAAQTVKPHSVIYDLGCSLGAASLAIRRQIQQPDCHIIAVDNSSAMTERCVRHMEAFRSQTPVEVRCDNILNVNIENASFVVLNFTLQFIEPTLRQNLLDRIYQGLKPGGALVLSEKIQLPDSKMNDWMVDLYHEFKRQNGYSELEISQKRSMLENVMRLDTLDCHQNRLNHAGFRHVSVWYQYLNFASIVAIKESHD